MDIIEIDTEWPKWERLPTDIKNEWEKSIVDFYPAGAIPDSEIEQTAKYDYEMGDTLRPVPLELAVADD
jgi:hypothetical protein